MIKALVKIQVASPDPPSSVADVLFTVKQNLVIFVEFGIFIKNEMLFKDPFIFDVKMQFILNLVIPLITSFVLLTNLLFYLNHNNDAFVSSIRTQWECHIILDILSKSDIELNVIE